ncbi:CHAT domain-containing protein [Microcoleus sp. CAWBG640]|uniref:CHAT domain-containing protein n=1 Tax=Microcoleus sp. CAWBG640 TaxID=2841653 RepID=UPI00312B5AE3
MNQQPTYLTLIQSLLTCPSDEEITILQANLELLDEDFAQYLREWATQTLAEMESEEAYNIANILYGFNITFSSLQQGSRASNIEIAIACLEVGLIIFTHEAYLEKWGMLQNSLGIKYRNRIRGDRGENIEKAIECYEAALEVYTRPALPQQWAMTQNNLAAAYRNRIRGDRGENIEKAIECYEAALEVRTRPALPQDWAMTQNNLATAYKDRIWGDRGENIEKAIAFYEAALEVRTPTALPIDCTTRKSPPPNQQQLFALQNPTEDLFNADMEVETIKTRFDLHQILLKKQATKIAFNANGENIANASYLHFSCHGVFDFDYPLQSSLVLADSLEPVLEINPPQPPEINPPQPPEINPPNPPLLRGGLREENSFAKGGAKRRKLLC